MSSGEIIFTIIAGIILALIAMVFACCVAAKRADEREYDILKSDIGLTGIKKKKSRGFEFVSKEQIEKDFDEDVELIALQQPKRATKGSAGYDCCAPMNISLKPGEDIKVPTGLKAYMQDGEVLMAFPRSGLGFKYYCRLSNTVGIIDKDYYNNENNEGHIFVKLRNEGDKDMEIKCGEAMCQFIFMPFLLADGDDFDNGETRNGGFGSTTKTV